MIKNIIFDVDGVLREMKDAKILDIIDESLKEKYFEKYSRINVKQFFKKYCILSYAPYRDYDLGFLTEAEFAKNLEKDFGVDPELFLQVFAFRCKKTSQIFFDHTFALAKKLKNEGFRLFVLSNMGKSLSEVLKSLVDVSLFEDMAFSCDIHKLKPNNDIYEFVLSKWNIDPKQSLFIDDHESNLLPFAKLGGHTFLFDKHDVDTSVTKLAKLINYENSK